MLLNIATALIVGFYVRTTLTRPIRHISSEVSKVDTSKPDTMQAINFEYKKHDEIGSLTHKTNALILALQQRFKSEVALGKATEDLQNGFRLIFEQSTAGIALFNQDCVVTLANPAFNELFATNMQNTQLTDHFEATNTLLEYMHQLTNMTGSVQFELDLVSYSCGNKRHLHCVLSSISDTREDTRASSQNAVELIDYDVTQRREDEQKALYEAAHDPLTGLLNRRAGQAWIDDALQNLSPARPLFALMMIDLDKFKPINDTHGHDAGDTVLVHVSKNLRKAVKTTDTKIIRWGGDEFLVGMSDDSEQNIEVLAAALLLAIGKPISINDGTIVQVGASIGVLIVHENIKNEYGTDKLIRKADELMYHTKRNHKNSVQTIKLSEIEPV